MPAKATLTGTAILTLLLTGTRQWVTSFVNETGGMTRPFAAGLTTLITLGALVPKWGTLAAVPVRWPAILHVMVGRNAPPWSMDRRCYAFEALLNIGCKVDLTFATRIIGRMSILLRRRSIWTALGSKPIARLLALRLSIASGAIVKRS